LEAFHHPYFANERSEIQMAMAQTAQKWLNGLGGDQQETLRRLTKVCIDTAFRDLALRKICSEI
jgi:hypothetical protein